MEVGVLGKPVENKLTELVEVVDKVQDRLTPHEEPEHILGVVYILVVEDSV